MKELARHINVSTFEELAALLDVPDMNEVLKDIPSAEEMLKDFLSAEEALKHIPVSELNDPDIDEVLKDVPPIEELDIPSIDDFTKDEK